MKGRVMNGMVWCGKGCGNQEPVVVIHCVMEVCMYGNWAQGCRQKGRAEGTGVW